MEILSAALDLALFLTTVFVVGKRPTFPKMAAMIIIVACVEALVDTAQIFGSGMGLYDWYLQALQTSVQNLSQTLSSEQNASLNAALESIAGCLPAIYLVQAAISVFVALGLLWVVRRLLKHPCEWSPFSQVDLPVWTVIPLVAGFLLIAYANLPQAPNAQLTLIVALNLITADCVFLFVQGSAALKGFMNTVGISAVGQAVIVLVAAFFGVFFLVAPVVGLVDYWANIRKLPRES